MKSALQNKLYEKYPKIFAQHNWSPTKTAMIWGFECGAGWYELLDNLCQNIQNTIDVLHLKQIEATQVKQKFGSLRFHYTPPIDEIEKLVEAACIESENICEECGTRESVQESVIGGIWKTPLCGICKIKLKGE
jgi:hypothetical protein